MEWDEDGWQDWHHGGKNVEIKLESVKVVAGKLWVYDCCSTADGDEIPFFVVEDKDGIVHNFASASAWRFVGS